jgi:FKBP-type peptidyl-prolyl cis-trans isomerase FkpA
MLNKFIPIAILLGFIAGACNTFKKTEGGLEYRFIHDVSGETAIVGDILMLEMKYSNAKDTFDTYKHGTPLNAMLDSVLLLPGTIEEGLLLLSSGDSVIFKVQNKVLYEVSFKEALPKELNPNDRTTFYIKVDTIYKRKNILSEQIEIVSAYKKKMLDSAEIIAKIKQEEPEIVKYLKNKNLNYTRTSNGIYRSIIISGKGEAVKEGSTVTTHYVGKLLNDSIFQDTKNMQEPFTFISGAGQAVLGWDEAFEGLTEGTKAIIALPSPLAYGDEGIEDASGYLVPPNSPIVFEISLKTVRE